MSQPFYAIQPAFTGGEISEDVASRVDLDKYQLALIRAENLLIRPYGSAKKRTGTKYCGETKNSGRAILRRFEFATELSYMLEIGAGYIRIWRDGNYIGVELKTPFAEDELENIRTVQSVDVMYICTGKHPVYKLSRYAEDNWTLKEVEWTLPPFGEINDDEDLKLSFSGTKGTITVTANKGIFKNTDIGECIKVEQRVGGVSTSLKTAEANGGTEETSSAIQCGETWKIITHGTWTGKVTIEQSTDGTTWKELRSYTSNNDYNPTESGTVEETSSMRIRTNITSGTVTADLSAYPYKATGYIKITGYTDATHVTAESTVKPLGTTTATADFYRSAWGADNGYPYTVTFFQDRLCFGGCPKYPQRVWMSRSGDYENFEVEKEGGTVTDDSAVTAELLSLKSYQIRHLIASNDLLVLTEGNTWTISGSETVTPSNISPRNQENYGANNVEPMKVGTRIVYVQRRGNTVRDVGYTYDSDSYVGVDLTLLSKDLFRDTTIKDGAYVQEPDSIIYYVRSDGVMLCLTYVPEQKVYAWSHLQTAGEYEAVCSVSEANQDRVFTIVKRTINGTEKRYIEEFDVDHHTKHQQDYHMLDSYVTRTYETATETISGLEHLEGCGVYVLADNYFYDGGSILTVKGGAVTLPETVKEVTVGLPYTMRMEQPNFDIGNTETGTLQGRKKYVSSAILRLSNSYGGGITTTATGELNRIIYQPENMELGEDVLYSGDKEMVLGKGGYDTGGRTYIVQDTPYPFTISAIIREVTLR